MEPLPDAWRTDHDGALMTEADGVRLVVPAPKAGSRQVHFLVLRRVAGSHCILGSGTQENLRDAMDAAMRMAARFRLPWWGRGH